MTPMRPVWLVARRELQQGVRNRALRITFTLMVLAIVAGAFLPLLFTGEDTTTLGVGDGVDVDHAALVAAGETVAFDLEVTPLTDDAAVAAVDDGELDAALVGSANEPRLVVRQQPDPTLRAVVADVLTQQGLQDAIAQTGVDPDELAQALAAAPELVIESLREPDDPGAFLFAFAGTILLFFAVAFFASRVLTGVVEEKSSRVVEVVLGTLRPEQLLAGKLIGIGLLALGQVVVLIAVAVTSLSISGTMELPTATAATVVGLIGWFLIGFATYSAIYAAAGALAPRIEDAQSSAGPIGTLMFVAYFVTFIVVAPAPDSLASQIVSQIPGIAPLAMPARIALDAVSGIELVIAVVISLAATYGAVRLAGVIYQRSVLRTQKATWREMLSRSER